MTDTVLQPTDPRRPGAATGRRATGLVVLIVLLAVASILSLFIGANGISPITVLKAVFANAQGTDAAIVREYRVTRLLLGLSVGCALGLAGAVMQALTRNPLADPGLLGVSAGACTAVVIAIIAHENGSNPYASSVIAEGVRRALT